MHKDGFTEVVNFMTPWEGVLVLRCGHISYLVIMHLFFSSRINWGMDQSYRPRKDKIVNFMTTGAGILVLGMDMKMQYFFFSCIQWVMDETN